MSASKHRVVLDTNEIVGAGASWLSTGTPRPRTLVQKLVCCVCWQHTGLYSDDIFDEYVRVLYERPHNKDLLIQYIGTLRELLECVTVVSTICPHPPTDPDDEAFILCAIDGKAGFIVTEDKHLRALRAVYNPPLIGNVAELSLYFGIVDCNTE